MQRDYCLDPIERNETSRVARHTVVSPRLSQTYRLAVVCRTTDADAVQTELKSMFEENGLWRFSLLCEQAGLMFVRLTALLESTIAERAALVRIVNRLATMASVRRLQWETVPNR